MADILKADGLVLYITTNPGGTYPFACANNTTISITREMIELAPKTNNSFRRYIKGRSSFTMSGGGLIKIVQSGMQPISFFDNFIKGTDTIYDGRFDMIDPQGNYKKYSFQCYITELTLENTYGQIPSYSFNLQGVGGFTEIL